MSSTKLIGLGAALILILVGGYFVLGGNEGFMEQGANPLEEAAESGAMPASSSDMMASSSDQMMASSSDSMATSSDQMMATSSGEMMH